MKNPSVTTAESQRMNAHDWHCIMANMETSYKCVFEGLVPDPFKVIFAARRKWEEITT